MTKKTAAPAATKAPAETTPETEGAVSESTPTSSPSVRQSGLQIDGFGLPVNGPARARVLAELGSEEKAQADPLTAPKEWNDALAAKASELTEKFYG